MRITWKDGITTLSTAGAITLERAHFHDFGIPLIANARWAIIGIGVLAAVGFIFGYLLDESHDRLWSALAALLGIVMLGVIVVGLLVASSDLVVLLMLSTVVFWLVSVVSHAMASAHVTHGHV